MNLTVLRGMTDREIKQSENQAEGRKKKNKGANPLGGYVPDWGSKEGKQKELDD